MKAIGMASNGVCLGVIGGWSKWAIARSRQGSLLIFCFLGMLSYQVANADEPVCEAYVPVANGCSDAGWDASAYGTYYDFDNSCDSHDICYQTIGKSQVSCDDSFKGDMLDSCEKDYLQFEAWQKTGTEDVLKNGLYCSVLGIPTYCLKWITQDVYGWVKVSEENAQRTVELPGYALCVSQAQNYYLAVRGFGKDSYKTGQGNATRHAEALAHNQKYGNCNNTVEPKNANLFSNDNSAVAKALYTNLLNREATQQEIQVSATLASTDPHWQFTLINNLVQARTVQALSSVLSLILE